MKTKTQFVILLNVGSGALFLLAALALFGMLALADGIVVLAGETQAAAIVALVAVFVSTFLALMGLPSVIGGWALWRGKSWARPLLLVVSGLNLLNVPFGTLIGAYTLWALLSEPDPSAPAKDAVTPPTPAQAIILQ